MHQSVVAQAADDGEQDGGVARPGRPRGPEVILPRRVPQRAELGTVRQDAGRNRTAGQVMPVGFVRTHIACHRRSPIELHQCQHLAGVRVNLAAAGLRSDDLRL